LTCNKKKWFRKGAVAKTNTQTWMILWGFGETNGAYESRDFGSHCCIFAANYGVPSVKAPSKAEDLWLEIQNSSCMANRICSSANNFHLQKTATHI